MNSPELFIGLNLFLVLYLAWNCSRTFQRSNFAWLQPPVLASILHFGVQYAFPNVRYVVNSEWHELSKFLPSTEIFLHLNNAMLAIVVAAVGMWIGYGSRIAESISKFLTNQLRHISIMRSDFEINFWTIIVLIAMGIAAPILQIQMGVFGYFSDGEGLLKAQAISQWINLLSSGGKLALLVLSVAIFSERYRRNQIVRALFILLLLFQVFVGLIGGFKSQVFMPFLFVGVGYYLVKHRISFRILIIAAVALVLSYVLVEPLRRARFSNPTLDNRDIYSVVNTALQSFANTFEALQDDKRPSDFTIGKLQQRVDLTTVTAVSLQFADNGQVNELTAPKFLQNIVLIPFHAFIPRFLWDEKALANDGWWFSVYVLGRPFNTNSSTAMGPVSYLYFAGGHVLVFLGFWAIGLFQQVYFRTFAKGQIGSWIVYLGVLYPIVAIESNVAASGAGVLRLIPFLLIAQSLVVKRSKKSS